MIFVKNLLKKPNTPVIICAISLAILVTAFVLVLIFFLNGRASLATQQQWASGKESFDSAYEIAAADKDTPDKTLYVPKLKDQLGKKLEDAVKDIGQGAVVVSSDANQTVCNLTNESANLQNGTPTVVFGTEKGIVKSASFSCSTWLLGYGPLSFVDMINNEHCIEKVLNEAGLQVDYGIVVAPTNRASYTTYAQDGTTVSTEKCEFSGASGRNKWSASLVYDYTLANTKGNLANTIRTVSVTIS